MLEPIADGCASAIAACVLLESMKRVIARWLPPIASPQRVEIEAAQRRPTMPTSSGATTISHMEHAAHEQPPGPSLRSGLEIAVEGVAHLVAFEAAPA